MDTPDILERLWEMCGRGGSGDEHQGWIFVAASLSGHKHWQQGLLAEKHHILQFHPKAEKAKSSTTALSIPGGQLMSLYGQQVIHQDALHGRCGPQQRDLLDFWNAASD